MHLTSCDPDTVGGCIQVPVDTLCDSSQLCVTDTCDPIQGCLESDTPNCCGNSLVDTGEECDDGNAVDGDGCDSSCAVEPLPIDCVRTSWNRIPPALMGLQATIDPDGPGGNTEFDVYCDMTTNGVAGP